MKEIPIHELHAIPNMRQYLETLVVDGVFEVSFVFDSSFKNAKILRDVVDGICNIMGLDSKWKTRIVLIVDELNNNAIEYGSKESDMNKLNMYVAELSGGGFDVKISVEDAGTGEKSKTAEEMEQLRQERTTKGFKNHTSIRGRGLFMIITNLVDTLYFQNSEKGKGLIVGIEKKL